MGSTKDENSESKIPRLTIIYCESSTLASEKNYRISIE